MAAASVRTYRSRHLSASMTRLDPDSGPDLVTCPSVSLGLDHVGRAFHPEIVFIDSALI
jgi:hypothetical protein